MLYKDAKKCRQSPLDKASKYVENASKVAGTVASAYNLGKMIYQGYQTVAPIVAPIVAGLL
jgi:hypothetical protein